MNDMTPTFPATSDHAKAIIRLREKAGVFVTTMPACPAPRSSSIVPHWVPDAAIIALMNGSTS